MAAPNDFTGKEKTDWAPSKRTSTRWQSPPEESDIPGQAGNEQRQKTLKQIADSEQYALVAAQDDWFLCLHKDRPYYYLHVAEVWKYGVGTQGALGRYALSFLVTNNVSYIIQFRGSRPAFMTAQQSKLLQYPQMPENLARPVSERLPRPPYNAAKGIF